MFYLIRIVLSLAVLLLSICLIKRSPLCGNRKVYILCVAICFALASLSCYIPVENKFCSFESAEEVFFYTNWEEIQFVLEGEDSCLVVYESAPSTSSFSLVGKDEDGYKILPQYSAEIISHKSDANGIIVVYRVKNTNDYYIQATLGHHGNIQVFDENGEVESAVMTVANTGIYDIYVKDLSESAYLVVDGSVIKIIS